MPPPHVPSLDRDRSPRVAVRSVRALQADVEIRALSRPQPHVLTVGAGPAILEVLERVLESRKVERPAGSYSAGLFERGEPQICRKIGEEATEVVTAALGGEGDARVVSEVADLWFHTMVLLASRGIPLRQVFEELAMRHSEKSR